MFLHCSALSSIYWRRQTFLATLAASLQGNVHLSVGWNFYISDTYSAKRINPPDLWSPDLFLLHLFPADGLMKLLDGFGTSVQIFVEKIDPMTFFLAPGGIFSRSLVYLTFWFRFTKNISALQSHDCGCRCWVFPIIKGLGPALKRFYKPHECREHQN